MKAAWVLVLWVMAASPVFADITQPLRFSGFGTVGVVFSRDDGGDYIANYEQNEGAGFTHGKDYGVDSVFGVQADLAVSRRLQATAQMQSRRIADGSSTPYFEWANLKYAFDSDLSVRAGRVVAPMFMTSESRAIGYAHTALRLPPDVYLLNPVTYLDGGGINYQFDIGGVIYSANVTVGTLDKELPSFFGNVELRFDTRLANLIAEIGSSQFRVGYAEATIDFDSDVLDDLHASLAGLVDLGVEGASTVKDSLVHEGFKGRFASLGYQFDNGRYLVQAEYVVRRSDSFMVYDVDGFTLLAGYRIEAWTPYVRFAQADSVNSDRDLPMLDARGLGDDEAGQVAVINYVSAALKTYDERKTWTAGLRWDISDNYALKVQADHIRKPAGQSGLFINTTMSFEAEARNVSVYSVALDFIF